MVWLCHGNVKGSLLTTMHSTGSDITASRKLTICAILSPASATHRLSGSYLLGQSRHNKFHQGLPPSREHMPYFYSDIVDERIVHHGHHQVDVRQDGSTTLRLQEKSHLCPTSTIHPSLNHRRPSLPPPKHYKFINLDVYIRNGKPITISPPPLA
jgi:hypothetical protein